MSLRISIDPIKRLLEHVGKDGQNFGIVVDFSHDHIDIKLGIKVVERTSNLKRFRVLELKVLEFFA